MKELISVGMVYHIHIPMSTFIEMCVIFEMSVFWFVLYV